MGKSSVSDLSEHVFDLIQELFAIDPMLLTSVMPQLEFKLKVNPTHTVTQWIDCFCFRRLVTYLCNFSACSSRHHGHLISPTWILHAFVLCVQSNDGEERLAVVRLLAKLFGAKDSELASQNRPLWQCFLGR